MKCVIYLISLCHAVLLNAQMHKAIELFDKNKYNEALTEWNLIISQGGKGEQLYYNIANTYYQLNQYPKAILYYNKALKWNPNCKDCQNNLKLARKAANVESFELPEFILTKYYRFILLCLQPLDWLIIGMFTISFMISISFLKIKSLQKLNLKPIRYFLLLFGFLCILLAIQRDNIKHNRNEGILMKQTKLHLSPDLHSELRQELIPGQFLKIQDKISGWLKVQTKEFDQGWIEEDKLEIIEL